MSVELLVLTGGPCSGKSTIINFISKYNSFLVVPETASILVESGIPRDSLENRIVFQKMVYKFQCYYEKMLIPTAKHLGKNILCDRGTVDCAAYWPNDNFFMEMETTILNEYSRYAMVIYLSSLATELPEEYSCIALNHPTRNENLREAFELDNRLKSIWNKHPNFYEVCCSVPGIEGKRDKVIELITKYFKI